MRACERPGVIVGASAAGSACEARPFLAYGGSPEARLPATAKGTVRAARPRAHPRRRVLRYLQAVSWHVGALIT